MSSCDQDVRLERVPFVPQFRSCVSVTAGLGGQRTSIMLDCLLRGWGISCVDHPLMSKQSCLGISGTSLSKLESLYRLRRVVCSI